MDDVCLGNSRKVVKSHLEFKINLVNGTDDACKELSYVLNGVNRSLATFIEWLATLNTQ